MQFTTIYPGWYTSRTIHIHVRIRTYDGSTVLTDFTTQIFFDDATSNIVLASSLYSRSSARDTTNATDNVYSTAANKELMMASVAQTSSGYAATITIDMAATTASSSNPVIAAALNAASGAPGLAPGSWISLFGTDLSTDTHVLESADIVGGYLPTSLQAVGVLIDGKSAYLSYVSPSQINALVPASTSSGQMQVTVTNSNGTSASYTATMQQILPGLFIQNNYVLAVRPVDGVIINGSGGAVSGYTTAAAAKPGDILEIYGTGFGPTTPSATPGLVFTGAYPTTNDVTVTIGGSAATVLFAGLVGAGLYQINIVVPGTLAAGDYAVTAIVGGYTSQSSVVLKVAVS